MERQELAEEQRSKRTENSQETDTFFFPPSLRDDNTHAQVREPVKCAHWCELPFHAAFTEPWKRRIDEQSWLAPLMICLSYSLPYNSTLSVPLLPLALSRSLYRLLYPIRSFSARHESAPELAGFPSHGNRSLSPAGELRIL